MASMCEITSNIKIVYGMITLYVGVTRRYYPSFDGAIVSRGTDLGFRRTSTPSKDDRSHNIEMSAEGEFHFENRRILLPSYFYSTIVGILRSRASSPTRSNRSR